MTAAPRSDTALLNKLLSGQAASDQRFEEILRRLDRAESTAGEARDTARELVTILREQDTGARIVEIRTELRAGMAELRQDFVAANTRVRTDLDTETTRRVEAIEALEARLVVLEGERNKVVGVASFFSWLARVTPWLIALGAAAIAGNELKGG